MRDIVTSKISDIPNTYNREQPSVNYGSIIKFEYESSKEKKNSGTILLPYGYDASNEYYNVLYLYHGYGDTSDKWVQTGKVRAIVGNLVESGCIGNIIVVMPDILDKTTVNDSKDEKFALFYNFKSLLKHLIPYVEANYRVNKEQQNRAIAGLSAGGMTTLYNAYVMKNTFNAVGAFCPTVLLLPVDGKCKGWINDKDKFIIDSKFIFIGSGAKDSSAGGYPREYSDVLTANITDDNVKNVFAIFEDGAHNWDTFSKFLYQFLKYDFFRNKL